MLALIYMYNVYVCTMHIVQTSLWSLSGSDNSSSSSSDNSDSSDSFGLRPRPRALRPRDGAGAGAGLFRLFGSSLKSSSDVGDDSSSSEVDRRRRALRRFGGRPRLPKLDFRASFFAASESPDPDGLY